MPITEPITLHVVPFSHPCLTARAGLQHKGLEFNEVTVPSESRVDFLEGMYGEGNITVPGIVAGNRTVHSSISILRFLDEEVPERPLYPDAISAEVREAEEWGDAVFQTLARRLVFGALHFRPGSMGTFAGSGELDPAGTDFAIKLLHQKWMSLHLGAVRLTEDLAGMPAAIEQIEDYATKGLLGSDEPTAADFQIGASARLLMTIGDLGSLFEGSTAERIAIRYFPEYEGAIPTAAFPEAWISF